MKVICGKVSYPQVYLWDIVNTQGLLFERVANEHCNTDFDKFTETYMKSNIRELLDVANPRQANYSSYRLLEEFIKESGFEFNSVEEDYLHQADMFWVGSIYALYQWRYNIPSKAVVKFLTPEYMTLLYPSQHCNDLTRTIEDLGPIPESRYKSLGIGPEDFTFKYAMWKFREEDFKSVGGYYR